MSEDDKKKLQHQAIENASNQLKKKPKANPFDYDDDADVDELQGDAEYDWDSANQYS